MLVKKWKLSKSQPLYSSICAWLSLLNCVAPWQKLAVPWKERAIQNEECPCLRDDEPFLKWDLIILIIAFTTILARIIFLISSSCQLSSNYGMDDFEKKGFWLPHRSWRSRDFASYLHLDVFTTFIRSCNSNFLVKSSRLAFTVFQLIISIKHF